MLIFQTMPMVPWWAALIALATGAAMGVMAALPWRSSALAATSRADNAEAERDAQREAKKQVAEENTLLKADIAVLKAKTDLNGLKAEMTKAMEAMRTEFKDHSDQDLATAKDHITAMAAVNTTLEALREHMRNRG